MQEQPGQMVPLRAPPPPPTRLSGKWLWLGPTRAACWRKLRARVGIGSPEDEAKLPQGCGWGERACGWRTPGKMPGLSSKGFPHPAHPGLLRPMAHQPPFPSSEHLWGMCPGADSPPSGPCGKRTEGRSGHPWCARLRQLCLGRRLGSGHPGAGRAGLSSLTEGPSLSSPVLRRAGASTS